MQPISEADLAGFLNDLSALQDELLAVLTAKREALSSADTEVLESLQARESDLVERLQAVQGRRATFLTQAASEGIKVDSLRSLAESLPLDDRASLREQFTQSATKARLIQHQSLTNWVLIQRTLLHLSQVLEIIATGGRLQPTYGKGASNDSSGSLVDHAA